MNMASCGLIEDGGSFRILVMLMEQFDMHRQGAVLGKRGQVLQVEESGIGDVVAQFVGLSSNFAQKQQL